MLREFLVKINPENGVFHAEVIGLIIAVLVAAVPVPLVRHQGLHRPEGGLFLDSWVSTTLRNSSYADE